MEVAKIVQGINDLLAGELLTIDALKIHIDSVIDDINAQLCAKFPTISEFNSEDYAQYPNYDFIPDKYIRAVIIPGAAYKFFITDEEGMETAVQYKYNYSDALFRMERDYMELVPQEYIDEETTGSITVTESTEVPYYLDW